MKTLFFLIILQTFATLAFACESPSQADAANFFRENDEWSRLDSADTNLEHQNKPVDIQVNFSNPGNSKVLWNGSPVSFSGLQVCKTGKSHIYTIRSNWPRITLTRMQGGLLRAKALGISFYFRSSQEVVDN